MEWENRPVLVSTRCGRETRLRYFFRRISETMERERERIERVGFLFFAFMANECKHWLRFRVCVWNDDDDGAVSLVISESFAKNYQ